MKISGFLIYETDNFVVKSRHNPHVDRSGGGHIVIYPKVSIEDRTGFSKELAIELMKLSMVVGEAMSLGMRSRGVAVVRINYEDLGNWPYKYGNNPFFHLHLYGRSWDEKYQSFPEALVLPPKEDEYYTKLECLNEEDVLAIKKSLAKILKKEKYKNR